MTDSIIFSTKSNIKAVKSTIAFIALIISISVTGCSTDLSSISDNTISEIEIYEVETVSEENVSEEYVEEEISENSDEEDEKESLSDDSISEETNVEEGNVEDTQDEIAEAEEIIDSDVSETVIEGEVSTTEAVTVTEETPVTETQPIVAASTTTTCGMTEVQARDKVNTGHAMVLHICLVIIFSEMHRIHQFRWIFIQSG